MTAQADTSGSKNAIQSIGSTITYLERYSLLALTGLAAHEMDDDGKAGATELISKDEANTVLELLQDAAAPVEKFLAYMNVQKIEDIPKSELKRALEAIKAKKAKEAVVKK